LLIGATQKCLTRLPSLFLLCLFCFKKSAHIYCQVSSLKNIGSLFINLVYVSEFTIQLNFRMEGR
jgi:hypothetical protein